MKLKKFLFGNFFGKKLRILKQNVFDKRKYYLDKKAYSFQCADNSKFRFNKVYEKRIINEHNQQAGNIDGHYFFQDIIVANKILQKGIKSVYDIGSRVDGYISHLLSMGIDVTLIDIRPLDISYPGLHFLQSDAITLNQIEDNSLEFLTSLHALEHFGLGRYGDPIDYDGWRKSLYSMMKKVKIRGG